MGKKWIVDNIITEIIFGILLLPLIWRFVKFLYEYFIKSRKIEFILSIHNNPDRTWRKGIYASDRFMEIYEAKVPLSSNAILRYGGGDAGAAWHTEYIDKCILERYGLVTVFEKNGRKKVKINKNVVTDTIYKRIKNKEDCKRKLLKKYEQERKKPPC